MRAIMFQAVFYLTMRNFKVIWQVLWKMNLHIIQIQIKTDVHTCRMINLAYRNDHEIKERFPSLIHSLTENERSWILLCYICPALLVTVQFWFSSRLHLDAMLSYSTQILCKQFCFSVFLQRSFWLCHINWRNLFFFLILEKKEPLQLHYCRCPRWTCVVFCFAPHFYPLVNNASFGKSFSPFFMCHCSGMCHRN